MQRPARSRIACKPRGFTLIEMLVAMVILGLVAGMALPAMQRWYDAVQARAQVAAIVESLRGAAFAAGARRTTLVVDEGSFAAATPGRAQAASAPAGRVPLALPPGWQMVRLVPASFLSSGLCHPGMLVLETDRKVRTVVRIDGPICKIELAAAPAGA